MDCLKGKDGGGLGVSGKTDGEWAVEKKKIILISEWS